MTTKLHTLLFSALILFFVALPASAVMMEGPMDGFDDYLIGDNVRYDFQTSLFGTPTIDGDTLMFTPSDFDATAVGPGSAEEGETFLIKITSLNGLALDTVNIAESGDYQIINGMYMGTSVTWALGTFIDGVNPILSDDTTSAPGFNTWGTEHTHEDLAAESVILTVQNQLFATASSVGSFAKIEKKNLDITTTVVPVPAAVWMFGSVLATLGLFRRKAQAEA